MRLHTKFKQKYFFPFQLDSMFPILVYYDVKVTFMKRCRRRKTTYHLILIVKKQ